MKCGLVGRAVACTVALSVTLAGGIAAIPAHAEQVSSTTQNSAVDEEAPIDIANVDIAPIEDQQWALSLGVQPKLSITYDGKDLVEGVDYSTRYENNARVGVAQVYVRGEGAYAGLRMVNFNIIRRDLGTVTIDPIPKQPYLGKPVEPKLTIRMGEATLDLGDDTAWLRPNYEIEYSNNDSLGKAKVVVRASDDPIYSRGLSPHHSRSSSQVLSSLRLITILIIKIPFIPALGSSPLEKGSASRWATRSL